MLQPVRYLVKKEIYKLLSAKLKKRFLYKNNACIYLLMILNLCVKSNTNFYNDLLRLECYHYKLERVQLTTI